jgi:hypothetical protein
MRIELVFERKYCLPLRDVKSEKYSPNSKYDFSEELMKHMYVLEENNLC